MNIVSILPLTLALVLAPLLAGVINKVKAFFAGRRGVPVLQLYYDLVKLLRKSAVYSDGASWVVRAGPLLNLAAVLTCLVLLPLGGCPALLSFAGDAACLCCLLALARFALVLAALDTGSSFEGMGASRDVQFAALTEPAVFLAMAALMRHTGALSLSAIFAGITPAVWTASAPALIILVVVLFVVLLAENARIPVDDPNTHLELTMIHEVMVLDHGGPDLAAVFYAAALKLWLYAALVVGVAAPAVFVSGWANLALALAGMVVCAALVGVVESAMARLRLVRVPQLLVGALVLAAVGLVLLGAGS